MRMAQPSAEPQRPVEWASLSFEGAALEGYVLAERYLLKRFTSLVRGSYGLPFEGLDCASGEPVFIKLLSSAAVTSDKMGRELRTCTTLLAAQEEGPRPGARYLAAVRAVLPAASAQRDGRTIVNLPALVMDWYPGGDGHLALFAEQRRTQPLPEPLARHLFRQLTEALGCLHSLGIAHRDVKLENFVFDASYELKLTDFGSCIAAAGGAPPPRAVTGLEPDESLWRVGTQAYAAPELRAPAAYDPALADVWSAGAVLLLLLCPARVPARYIARLSHDPRAAPFWRHFSAGASSGVPDDEHLSLGAVDLLDRMLEADPDRRATLGEVAAHPWAALRQEAPSLQTLLTALGRPPPRTQPPPLPPALLQLALPLGGFGPPPAASEVSDAESSRGGAPPPRPRPPPAPIVLRLPSGCACTAAFRFRALIGHLHGQAGGQVLSDFARLQLAFFAPPPPGSLPAGAAACDALGPAAQHRFSACFAQGEDGCGLLLLHPSAAGMDSFSHWVDSVTDFLHALPDERSVRRRAANGGWPSSPRCAECGRGSDGGEGELISAIDAAYRTVAELVFDRYLGLAAGQRLSRARYLTHCGSLERLGLGANVPAADAERAWMLTVPEGEAGMDRELFVRASHLLLSLSAAVASPAAAAAAAAVALAAPSPRPPAFRYGTRDHPLPYNLFAALLRPLLLAEYERARAVYSKTTPVLALVPGGGAAFAPGSGDAFALRNLAPSLDAWSIERQHFVDNYSEPAGAPGWSAGDAALAGGPQLCAAVEAALRAQPQPGFGEGSRAGEARCALSAEDWAALAPMLRAEAAAAGPAAAWRIALPRNHVVAVALSEDMLSERLRLLDLAYTPGVALYREETYARAVPFAAGDYVVSDVVVRGGGSGGGLGTADGAWVFKPLIQAKRGETLITRTIERSTFDNTYTSASQHATPHTDSAR